MMSLIPRAIHFKNKVATASQSDYDEIKVIDLPSDHYDFIGPIQYIGNTEEEIKLLTTLFMLKEQGKNDKWRSCDNY